MNARELSADSVSSQTIKKLKVGPTDDRGRLGKQLIFRNLEFLNKESFVKVKSLRRTEPK